MVSQKKIISSLDNWFKRNHPYIKRLSQQSVNSRKGVQADYIFIQSRSDIIHIAEIKTHLSYNILESALWQLESMNANYKWLIIPEDEYYQATGIYSIVRDSGFGLLLFSGKDRIHFEKKLNPIYLDGNFIDDWPSIASSW